MWPSFLFAALAFAILGWAFTAFRQTRKVHALERSKEEIQVEETLVFDFLHGLGEAFRETIRPHDLHRLIVEGATRILDAHGGALYLADRSGDKARAGISFQGLSAAGARCRRISCIKPRRRLLLGRFLRACINVAAGEGLIGTVWQSRTAGLLSDVSEVPELARLRETPRSAPPR